MESVRVFPLAWLLCVLTDGEEPDGHFYTHIGAAGSAEELRLFLLHQYVHLEERKAVCSFV